jgi:hypothetical protein
MTTMTGGRWHKLEPQRALAGRDEKGFPRLAWEGAAANEQTFELDGCTTSIAGGPVDLSAAGGQLRHAGGQQALASHYEGRDPARPRGNVVRLGGREV